MSTIRWHHRLAAWLYERIGVPLCNHATPVWNASAEDDIDAMWEAKEADAETQRIASQAYNDGYADGARDGELPF